MFSIHDFFHDMLSGIYHYVYIQAYREDEIMMDSWGKKTGYVKPKAFHDFARKTLPKWLSYTMSRGLPILHPVWYKWQVIGIREEVWNNYPICEYHPTAFVPCLSNFVERRSDGIEFYRHPARLHMRRYLMSRNNSQLDQSGRVTWIARRRADQEESLTGPAKGFLALREGRYNYWWPCWEDVRIREIGYALWDQ